MDAKMGSTILGNHVIQAQQPSHSLHVSPAPSLRDPPAYPQGTSEEAYRIWLVVDLPLKNMNVR